MFVCFFSRSGHHSLSLTQQLCPVDAKMQSIILAFKHLQMQALTSAAIYTSMTSDVKTTVTKTTEPPVKKGQVF